jgi:hypothetical protein
VADLIRVPNQIINVWFSQLVENRTLRNFQMHWYDATVQGYQPQVYEPGPGRMLPAPGDPNKTIMPVNIQGLDETLTAIDFIIRLTERGSGATAIEKGVSEKKQITLGEVEILVGKAMERTVSMAKFYRNSWYELCVKWDALMHANMSVKQELVKKGSDGKLWPKVVYPGDWKSDKGYRPEVSSSSEQEEEQLRGIQKWQFVLKMFPANVPLRKVAAKRSLELLDLTPEELRIIQDFEEKTPPQAAPEEEGAQPFQQELTNRQIGVPPPGRVAAPV